MDLRSYQQSAAELVSAAKAARNRCRENGDVDTLITIEEKLSKAIDSGLSLLPSEPMIVEILKEELKKTRRMRNNLAVPAA